MVTDSDFVSLDTIGIRGPRKADGSLPDTKFLHLKAGSKCINAGTDIGLPFSGSAPDLGAFEFSSTALVKNKESIVSDFILYQNYPNPFNPSTTIKFAIAKSSFVRLSVFDLLGREVSVLVNSKMETGYYSIIWDASKKSSGIYFCRLQSENNVIMKQMILIK